MTAVTLPSDLWVALGGATATQWNVDPNGRIDCGACVPARTSDSILAVDDLPEDNKALIEKNAGFYSN